MDDRYSWVWVVRWFGGPDDDSPSMTHTIFRPRCNPVESVPTNIRFSDIEKAVADMRERIGPDRNPPMSGLRIEASAEYPE